MEIGAIYKESVQSLTGLYGEEESASMVNILFEDLLEIDRIQRMRAPNQMLEGGQMEMLEIAIQKLLNHVPIQHIAGFTYFLGRKFLVNERVLIPRPETEELVMLVKNESQIPNPTILDVGTGSGCIAISLALEISGASVHSVDVSDEALIMAKRNDEALSAKVHFQNLDILKNDWLEPLDILVSNPPYIPRKERAEMNRNVTEHEPGLALFVPDDDPLIFYRRLGEIGMKCLKSGGKLYVEIHEKFGQKTEDLFLEQGYSNVLIHQDLNGKDRMVSALKET